MNLKRIDPEKLAQALADVKEEVLRSTNKHRLFASTHEAYAVMLEELEELWTEIKANQFDNAKREATQLAAMAVKFLLLEGLE